MDQPKAHVSPDPSRRLNPHDEAICHVDDPDSIKFSRTLVVLQSALATKPYP